MKRGRGRPHIASLAAAANRASPSSVATSTSKSAEPVSGNSTPLTSNVTTPAPSLSMEMIKPISTRSLQSTKLEVVIPMRKTRASATDNIQKAKEYMMGTNPTTSKRKRDFIADSDEEDFSNNDSNAGRTHGDEKIARQLQEELDREAAEAMEAQEAQDALAAGDDDHNDYNDGDAQQQIVDTSDSEDYPMADRKGKGKAVATRPPRAARAAAAKYMVPDSDEDDLDDDYSASDNMEPPAKKQKTVFKGRGKQSSAKGKQPVAALSESDDDAPGKLQTLFS